MITDLLTKRSLFKRYHSDKHLSEFYLQDGGKKSTCIGMEQNYVTVTLCIGPLGLSDIGCRDWRVFGVGGEKKCRDGCDQPSRRLTTDFVEHTGSLDGLNC